ncbi:hypothetical protein BDV28DRAFT_147715 [Aspergillus coremiiformis]|uniref:Uncharacterized protein n=1 Tax=Aspergillus coremiiformis TaxID=138285 RepID=A0A5N6Z8Q1_9EURO|nr:hypothetical protein BDV28DRAFT_147715 [Aspergillus coremiiformis]
MKNRLEALNEIVNMFDPEWRFTMAVYWAALIGQFETIDPVSGEVNTDNPFFAYFRSDISSEGIDLDSNDTHRYGMPESERVQTILREAHKHARIREAFDLITKAKDYLSVLKEGTDLKIADQSRAFAMTLRFSLEQLRDIQSLYDRVLQELKLRGAYEVFTEGLYP